MQGPKQSFFNCFFCFVVNQCYIRDLYNHWDHFLRKEMLCHGTFKFFYFFLSTYCKKSYLCCGSFGSKELQEYISFILRCEFFPNRNRFFLQFKYVVLFVFYILTCENGVDSILSPCSKWLRQNWVIDGMEEGESISKWRPRLVFG